MSSSRIPGRVSVVVVNYRGAEDTIACLDGLRDLDWPELEVIVVDNASGDGSAEVLTARFPDAADPRPRREHRLRRRLQPRRRGRRPASTSRS